MIINTIVKRSRGYFKLRQYSAFNVRTSKIIASLKSQTDLALLFVISKLREFYTPIKIYIYSTVISSPAILAAIHTSKINRKIKGINDLLER